MANIRLHSLRVVRGTDHSVYGNASGGAATAAPVLEGLVLDPVAVRKAARDEQDRTSVEGITMRAISGR